MTAARAGGREALFVGLLALVAVVVQVDELSRLFDPATIFGGNGAQSVAKLNAVLVAVAGLAAMVLPARFRWLLVAGAALPLAGVVAICSVGVPERGWSLVLGLLTFAACWEVGERLLARLGARELAGLVPVAWLVGGGVLASVLLVVGRPGGLAWWNVGLVFLVLGVVGSVRLVRRGVPHGRTAWAATTVSPLAAACAAVVLLDLAWLAIYAFAPETGVDALAAKAWLPKYWADVGDLLPLHQHPQFAIAGNAQVLAVPGHLLGGPDVGRWMQYQAGLALVVTAWWWGRRFGILGPLAAFATVLSPTFAFQAGTAFDDMVLTLAAAGLVLAVVTLLETRGREDAAEPGFRLSVAVGVVGGSVLSYKLHLVYLDIALLLGWITAGGARRGLLQRAAGVLAGGLATAAIPIVLRVVDWQNPVFPAYNNIFKSEYWPPVNEKFNFPFWPDAPVSGFLTWPWKALRADNPLLDIQTPGFLGLLLPIFVGAMLLVVPAVRQRPTRVLWIATAVSVLCWYASLRYLRYLMPIAFAGLLLGLATVRLARLGAWAERGVLVGLVVMAGAVFPSQVAQFYPVLDHKVPFAAARGSWAEASWLRYVWPRRDAYAAFTALTPPGTRVLSRFDERLWLPDRRDIVKLSEVGLQPGYGPLPTAPEPLRRTLDRFGVRWVMFEHEGGFGPEPVVQQLVDAKGELAWSDRNYEVWRLVERPRLPVAVGSCDPLLRAGGCWAGPALDRRPGLTSAEAGPGATTTVPTCEGQTTTVRITVPRGGVGADLVIQANDPQADRGDTRVKVYEGTTRIIGNTAPGGSTMATVTVTPWAGGTVSRAAVGRTGRSC